MGLGPQVIALYVQLKRNGTFDNITKVMEFGSQDLVFPGEKYNSLMVDLFETFDCDVPFEEELKQINSGCILVIPLISLKSISKLESILKPKVNKLSISQHQSYRGVSIGDDIRLSPLNPVFILKGELL